MALRDYFKFGKRSIFLDDNGKPKDIHLASKAYKTKGVTVSDRNESALNMYWKYYNGEGTIFASVNITAWNTIMVGYQILSDNPQSKLLISNYCEFLDLESILLESTVNTLIFGDAFIEKVKDSKTKDIVELRTVNPATMEIVVDKVTGILIGYQQTINGIKQPIIPPEDIIHICFFPSPFSFYGISLIEPSKDTLQRKVDTDESLAKAIERHGTSKWKIVVGTPTDFPTSTAFDNIKAQFEDIASDNEFVIPGCIDIVPIDEKGIQGVEEYYNYFQTQLIIGLLCPEEALGLGRGSTEATSRVKQMMYERMIKAFQLKISNLIQRSLFNSILVSKGFQPNTVKLKFNSVTDEDEAMKAKWLGNLLRGYPDGAKPFNIDEIRLLFGFPPQQNVEQPPQSAQPSQPSQPAQSPQPTPPKPEAEGTTNNIQNNINDLKNNLEKLKGKI